MTVRRNDAAGACVDNFMHKSVPALVLLALFALSACGNLPPGHVPVQPNAQQGGGAAYLQSKGRVAVP